MIGHVAQGDELTPDLERFGHLLSDQSFDIEAGPILYLTPRNIVRIADRSFVSFEFDEEYADHEQATLLLRDLDAFRREHGPRIERADCRLEWNDDLDAGRVDVSVLVPTELASRIGPGREHDFWDAVAALLGSKRVNTVTATFHPEAWKNDWAIEVDPQGETTFDVTFEVLVMGREAARLVEDNRDESDELRDAIHAPDWIRKWAGPFRVEVADEIAEFLDQREDEEDEARDCGQCGGTGTIEGGLSGDGEDEECPVCDGTGTLQA